MFSIRCELVCRNVRPGFSSRLRSQKHYQWSEGFSCDRIQSGIKTDPSANAEERLKMIELLKRLEGSNVEGVDSRAKSRERKGQSRARKGLT